MNELTQEGIKALKIGNKIRARNLLKMAIRQDPKDVQAWLWLSGAVESDAEKIDCLQSVLRLDPGNRAAAQGLAQLQGSQWVPEVPVAPEAAPKTETTLEPATEPESPEEPETTSQWQPEATGEPEPAREPDELVEMAEQASPEPIEVESVEETTPAATDWDNYDYTREELLYQPRESPTEENYEGGAQVFSVPEPEVLGVEEVEVGTTGIGIPVEAILDETEGETGQDLNEEKSSKSDKILKVGGPSFGYGTTVLVILLIVLAAIAAASAYFLTDFPYSILLGAALAIIWIVALLAITLTSLTTRYILTRRKLIQESGVLARKTRALRLEQVSGVQLNQGGLQRLAKVADITLTTIRDEPPMKLKSLAKYEEWLKELSSITGDHGQA